jgi:LytS/YehU family sensor histidine kinase
VAGLAVFGLLIVPALVAVVPLAELSIGLATGAFGGDAAIAKLPRRIAISALFSTPTYVAVIAVGQTLVWAERAGTNATLAASSELRAIRAELSPHFTMNALGAIAQLAYVSAQRAEAATHALADVLRVSLGEDDDAHTLADELGAVEAHLDLYRHLTGGVAFQRLVDDGAWGWRMPRHILVPLVENALTHGAADQDGTRHLTLRAASGADALAIAIENPVGNGPSPSSGLGLGLRQVADRLRLIYGGRATLTAAAADGMFQAMLSVPHG